VLERLHRNILARPIGVDYPRAWAARRVQEAAAT